MDGGGGESGGGGGGVDALADFFADSEDEDCGLPGGSCGGDGERSDSDSSEGGADRRRVEKFLKPSLIKRVEERRRENGLLDSSSDEEGGVASPNSDGNKGRGGGGKVEITE